MLLDASEYKTLLKAYNDTKDECIAASKVFTIGKVVANLNFGFWTNLCVKKYNSKIWNKPKCFYGVFVNYPNKHSINYIAKKLYTIRRFNSFLGTIDLKWFKVLLPHKSYSFNKTGTDIIESNDYNKIGAPNINSEGELTGTPNTSNCIKSPIIDTTNSNTMDIILEFRLDKAPTDAEQLYLFTYSDIESGQEIDDSPMFKIYHNYCDSNILKEIISAEDFTAASTYRYEGHFYADKKGIERVYKNGILLKEVSGEMTKSWKKKAVFWIGSGHGSSAEITCPLTKLAVKIDNRYIWIPDLRIPYTQSKTGSKIVEAKFRDRVRALYIKSGSALYYTLDDKNKNFTLPMGEVYGMLENLSNKTARVYVK